MPPDNTARRSFKKLVALEPLRTAFSPTDLGDTQLWFAADHITDVGNGGVVTSWFDGSGHGRTATSANSPTYIANVVNGMPVVRLNGTNQYFTISDFAFSSSATPAGLSVFVVAKYDAIPPAAYEPIINHFDVSAQRAWSIGVKHTTGRLRGKISADGGDGNFLNYQSGSAAGATGDFFIGAMVFGSSALSLYTNGVLENPTKTDDGTVATIHNSTADLTIGCELNGGSVIANSYMDGDIAELIVYDRELSADERLRVEAYLSNKYNINTYNPTKVPGLVAWYSAEQIPDLANGAVVTTWPDWVDEGATTTGNAAQGTTADKPQWKVSRQAGRPTVKFDGSDDFMALANLNLDAALTACFLIKDVTQTAGGSLHRAVLATDNDPYRSDGDGYGFSYSRDGSDRFRVTLANGTAVQYVQNIDGATEAFEMVVHTQGGGEGNLRRNGVLVEVERDVTGTMDRSSGFNTGYHLGWDGGVDGAAGRYYRGEIAEVIIFDRVLTDSEIGDLEPYVNIKYEVV